MAEYVIIDGNNLLHAMHAHAPVPQIGRETLVKLVERWADGSGLGATLVFDGPPPPEGLARQMAAGRTNVRFSAPVTADDVIVEMIRRSEKPRSLCVITSDKAIRHEAVQRRCDYTDARSFVDELFSEPTPSRPDRTPEKEKPDAVDPQEAKDWLKQFGFEDADQEPFDGHDRMIQ